MSDGNDQTETKGRLSLRPVAQGGAGHTVDAGSVRQSFSHGRSKVVQVEVRKKRGLAPGAGTGAPAPEPSTLTLSPSASAKSEAAAVFGNMTAKPAAPTPAQPVRPTSGRPGTTPRALTPAEIATRQRVLTEQQRIAALREAERREQERFSILSAAEEARRREEDEQREAELESKRAAEEALNPTKVEAPVDDKPAVEAKTPDAAGATAKAPEARPATTRPATPAATAETLRLKPGGRPA
jgi:translation initiation factor IF-2